MITDGQHFMPYSVQIQGRTKAGSGRQGREAGTHLNGRPIHAFSRYLHILLYPATENVRYGANRYVANPTGQSAPIPPLPNLNFILVCGQC